MHFRYGTVGTRNIAIVLAVVSILALGTYVAISSGQFSAPNASSKSTSSTQSAGTVTYPTTQVQLRGLIDLFGNFSRMAITTSYLDEVNEASGSSSVSYVVLGRTTLNSTRYYKVEFKNAFGNTSEIAWFSPQGRIDRVDVLGDKNYTGSAAAFFTRLYTNSFSLVPAWSYNVTLLSGLQKTGESIRSIGPTQMDVARYGLPRVTSAYANFTAEIATIPGTNARLAVYVFQQTLDGSNVLLQVTSVTRA